MLLFHFSLGTEIELQSAFCCQSTGSLGYPGCWQNPNNTVLWCSVGSALQGYFSGTLQIQLGFVEAYYLQPRENGD